MLDLHGSTADDHRRAWPGYNPALEGLPLATVILHRRRGKAWLAGLLSFPLLTWLGKLSYSHYL